MLCCALHGHLRHNSHMYVMAALRLQSMQSWQGKADHGCALTSPCTACAQVKAALQRWDGSGCFAYTGSAGIYLVEDGTEVREESETSPLGKDERTDRHVQHSSSYEQHKQQAA